MLSIKESLHCIYDCLCTWEVPTPTVQASTKVHFARAPEENCRDLALNPLACCSQVNSYCHAGARQFGFMLRGLKEMEPKLEALNIPFFMVRGDPIATIPKLVKDTKAALLVTDFASMRDGRRWRDTVSLLLSNFSSLFLAGVLDLRFSSL